MMGLVKVRCLSWLALLGACGFDPAGVEGSRADAPASADGASPGDGSGPLADAPPGGSDAEGDAPAPDGDPSDARIVDPCATAGVLTCPGATATFVCNGHCWIGCPESMTRGTANGLCTAWGGELARFDDELEQTCVRDHFVPAGAMWLGLLQVVGAGDLAAGWSWSGDGAVPPWTHWTSGQPNDGDGVADDTEQCAYLSNPTLTWQDAGCGSSVSGFACRL